MQKTLFDEMESGTQNGHGDGESSPKQGFKKTKVGWIPENWSVVKLRDLIRNLDAGTSVKGDDRQRVDGEKAVLKVSSASYGTFLPSEHKVIDEADLDRVDTYPKAGHVIISRANTYELVGASVFVEQDYPDLFLPDKLWQVELREDKSTSARWLNYALSTARMRYLISGAATGSSGSMKNISQKRFLSLPISVPPPAEQHQLANLIAKWDRSLAQINDLIAAKERRKKALMQQLLTGKTRLPRFSAEWEEVRLKKLGEIVTGGTPKTSNDQYWDGDTAWCTPTDITAVRGKSISETERTLTKAGLENSSATVLPPGSLIVCTRATIGDCAVNTVPMATNQGFKSIVPTERVNVDFLYYWLTFNTHELKRVAAGSTFLEISKRDFGKVKMQVPSLEEQNRIATVLSDCDNEIQTLRAERDALQRQKKGMMQKLLTGTVRVPAARSSTQAAA
jgi:type I restriction enzyme S subunit